MDHGVVGPVFLTWPSTGVQLRTVRSEIDDLAFPLREVEEPEWKPRGKSPAEPWLAVLAFGGAAGR